MISELKQQIKNLEKKIKSIQDQCSHPKEAVIKKYGQNSGNYDPSNDCSWEDYYCTLCDKRWVKSL